MVWVHPVCMVKEWLNFGVGIMSRYSKATHVTVVKKMEKKIQY
jgi:hypothetical protein